MKLRWLPRPLLSALILALWISLTNAASLSSALLGVLLALILPPATRRFWPDPPRVKRPAAALQLLAIVLTDIVKANWAVARLVVGPLSQLRPAFVEVPLDLRDPFIITILGSIVSLTPGTVSIDVDRERWMLQLHALDVEDPVKLATQIKQRYEARLKEIFAC